MIEFAFPWALLLLPLPLLMRLLPAYKESRDSVKVPFFNKLVDIYKEVYVKMILRVKVMQGLMGGYYTTIK